MLHTQKKVDKVFERFGGTGEATIEHYFDESMLAPNIAMYAKVTMPPGTSFGYHTHTGTSETIVVLKGIAQLNDDGVICQLHPGDITHCPDGHSHSIGNVPGATEDLELQALIVKTDK